MDNTDAGYDSSFGAMKKGDICSFSSAATYSTLGQHRELAVR